MRYPELQSFEEVKDNGAFYLIRKEYRQPVIDAVNKGNFLKTAKGGRGDCAIVPLDGQQSAVIRQYKRGGLSRFLLPDVFWGDNRAVKEVVITAQAVKAGVPAPEVLGIIIWPAFGPLCRLWIITREIKAPTLEYTIRSLKDIRQPDEVFLRKLELIKAVATTVKKLHLAGIRHRDLHIRNILIGADKAYIIDLDGATALGGKSDETESLIRLNRSIAKYLNAAGISGPDRLRLLKEYFDADYYTAHKKDIAARCIRNIRLHQLWWAISGQK